MISPSSLLISIAKPTDFSGSNTTAVRNPNTALYEKIYCARAHIENRIKELHHGLEIDRTSCPRFLANQFRVLLTAAAYVLMQELRRRAAGTGLARAQVSTLRERLLKLGARIERSVRRIVVHLPRTAAYQYEWRRIALAVGAVPASSRTSRCRTYCSDR
jgi:Transposase DDE domain group 1